MDILLFIILFFAWYGLSLWISVKCGKKHRVGEEWSFFLCMMLSPVVGFLITCFLGKKKQETA